MKVKMKIYEAINSNIALEILGRVEEKRANRFLIGISLKLAFNKRKVQEVTEQYEKNRSIIFKKYSKLNKEKDQIEVPSNKIAKFTTEINKIREEEIELDLKMISIDDLGKKYTIEPNVLTPLNWLFITVPIKESS